MIKVSIDLHGPEFQPSHWKTLSKDFEAALERLALRWRTALIEEAQKVAPKGSPGIVNSIYGHVDLKKAEIIIGSNHPAAMFQDLGTGIYSKHPNSPKQIIYPDKSRAFPIRVQVARTVSIGPGGPAGGGIYRSEQRGSKPTFFISGLYAKAQKIVYADVIKVAQKFGFK